MTGSDDFETGLVEVGEVDALVDTEELSFVPVDGMGVLTWLETE